MNVARRETITYTIPLSRSASIHEVINVCRSHLFNAGYVPSEVNTLKETDIMLTSTVVKGVLALNAMVTLSEPLSSWTARVHQERMERDNTPVVLKLKDLVRLEAVVDKIRYSCNYEVQNANVLELLTMFDPDSGKFKYED